MSSPPNSTLSPPNHQHSQHSRFLNANASSVWPGRGRFAQAVATLEADAGSETDIQDDTQPHASIPLQASVTQHGRRVAFGPSLPRPHRGDLNSSDDEVPQSLMIEATPSAKLKSHRSGQRARKTRTPKQPILPVANVLTPSRPDDLDEESEGHQDSPLLSASQRAAPGLTDYERALWSWVNVFNLDEYLQEVYAYYRGNGMYSIVLSRGLNLLTVGFVIFFTTFLIGCIDYKRIPAEGNGRLSDVVIDHCISKFSGFTLIFFTLFGAFYAWQIVTFLLGIPRLMGMYRFYTHLLNIPNEDIQTISWPEIVRRIGAIRDENPITALSSAAQNDPDYTTPTAKLDAHDVANRIMRQENYLIALFNKDLLDLRLPLPRPLKTILGLFGVYHESKQGTILTRALEWNLRFCLMDYLFDRSGRVRAVFLKDRNRDLLVKGLRTRFIFMGCVNALCVPFLVPYLLIYSFFRYFEEAKSDPSAISSRRYTPYAEWKFREFNELPHLFHRRLDTSYPTANMYLDQFPKAHVALIARFIAFIAGSFAAVLLLASLVDPDLFLNFEITPHRTVLFYIGVFATILAVSRSMIPDTHNVFDPEILMREVIRHTHYMPAEWKDSLHSVKVNAEFGQLFAMKAMIFVQEILSVVLTPLVLWFSLPDCAPAITDFFREFTVHVDGLGYVCSFAVFDFKRHGNVNFGAPTEQADAKLQSKDGKMEKSFLAFKAAHPEWNPRDPAGSLYLTRLETLHQNLQPLAASFSRQESLTRGAGYGSASTSLPPLHRSTLAERSQLYERALQHSMASASAGRPATGISGSMQMRTTGSRPHTVAELQAESLHEEMFNQEEERAEDGGLISRLGDSFADDVKLRGGRLVLDSQEGTGRRRDAVDEVEAEELSNGGVLGLLAQIYDRRRPPMM